ncbi:hypothetical protein AAG589_11335 [Isoptericola sp. F-RaC21]|uniref:hypothetical protein n=1 Tax=Isoptericola sp. F-RaC21 TaxID=3141452 RepID=UPI00315B4CFA
MTVATWPDRDAFAADAHHRAVRHVTRTFAGGTLIIGSWYWGVFLLITVAVPLVVHAFGGVMDGGVATGLEFSARWYVFSMGAVLTVMTVVTHLAAGGTRRALRSGTLRASGVAGVANGIAFVVVLVVERAVFGAVGWGWEPVGIGLASFDGGWAVVTAVSEALVSAIYLLGGVAVVAGYQSHGLWRGTLLVVPALLLLFLADVTSRTGAGEAILAGVAGDIGTTAPAVGLVAGAAVLALAVGAVHLQLRDLRLRPTR